MGKTYDQAPDEVHDRVKALLKRFYADTLAAAGLKIDLLMASTDTEDGHAVTHGGYPALAVVRIVSSKDRAKAMGDAEIVIDRDAYEAMSAGQRDALLDHELYHLELVLDRNGKVKRDDHRRPKLKMRKHDVQVGWFAEIARRHDTSSHEVRQATEIFEEHGQLFFGFASAGGSAAELRVGGADGVKGAIDGLVNDARASGMSVTIRSGNVGVKIDKDGIHSEPSAAQLVTATDIATRENHLTRPMLQRSMSVSYNMACAIIDRLIAMNVLSRESETQRGRFDLIQAPEPAAQPAAA